MAAREIFNTTDLGAVVRELRKERGWTQARLAEWLSVSRPTVAKLETGGAVNVDVAMRALAILGNVATIHPKGTRLVEENPK
jgi:transcriptional regulator with XRE-family HTH domain